MVKFKFIFALSMLCFSIIVKAQDAALFSDSMKKDMCEQVKKAAQHAWKGYKLYAWGADDLKPLTKEAKIWYKKSMLMTPVDAFDTFTLLGLNAEAHEAKQLILTQLNFNIDNDVQVFEITIRLLAGLITAYELDGTKKFITLAIDLADRLMPAFNTPTGMPYRYVHLQTGKTRDHINNPAEIGTLMLEFGKLSKITGNKKYYAAAKKAIMQVYKSRSVIDLVGEQIDVKTGKWVNTRSHIGAYIDSYYEYLYKSWLLFGDNDFKIAFENHNQAIKKNLISKTDHGWFMHQVDMNTGKEIGSSYGALEAFYAGLCAFSGDIETGRKIQEANYYMWTRFNIEPEEFNFKTDSVSNASYVLRPENLESCFYMYRLTRQVNYLWQGKVMVESILAHCKNEVGFAALKDVQTFEKANSMESFFFGETLKYAYLIFAPDKTLDFNQYVLTTEAHPFIIERHN